MAAASEPSPVRSSGATTHEIRLARLLGSKTIRVAQESARFQSPRDSCGEPDLTGNGLAAAAPALNDKFYTPLKIPLAGVIQLAKRVTF
jgi:hypothetical protein